MLEGSDLASIVWQRVCNRDGRSVSLILEKSCESKKDARRVKNLLSMLIFQREKKEGFCKPSSKVLP